MKNPYKYTKNPVYWKWHITKKIQKIIIIFSMHCSSVLTLLLSCVVWYPMNCSWYCILAPCGLATTQLGKSRAVRWIFVFLCLYLTPFLCILGFFHWVMGLGRTFSSMSSFVNGGGVEGFKHLVIPESQNEMIGKGDDLLNRIFCC